MLTGAGATRAQRREETTRGTVGESTSGAISGKGMRETEERGRLAASQPGAAGTDGTVCKDVKSLKKRTRLPQQAAMLSIRIYEWRH